MPKPVKEFGGFESSANASDTRTQDDHEEPYGRPLFSHLHRDSAPKELRKPIPHSIFGHLFRDDLGREPSAPIQPLFNRHPQNDLQKAVSKSFREASSEDSGELRARRREMRANRRERKRRPNVQEIIIKRPDPRASPQPSCTVPRFVEGTASKKVAKASPKRERTKRLDGPKWHQDSEKLALTPRNLTPPDSVDSWETPHVELERPTKKEKPPAKAVPIPKGKEEFFRNLAAEVQQRVKADRAVRKEKMKYIEEWREAVEIGAYKEVWRVIEISVVADCPPKSFTERMN